MGKTLSVRVCRRVAAIVAVVVAVAVPVAGQSTPPRPKPPISSTVSRTADGHPDLQGVWLFATLTPLQRPDNLAGRTHLTDEEIAAIEERAGSRKETFGLFPDEREVRLRQADLTHRGSGRREGSSDDACRTKATRRSRARLAAQPITPRTFPSTSGASSGSTPGPRSSLAATTSTSSWSRRATTSRSTSRWFTRLASSRSTDVHICLPSFVSGTEARAGDGKVTRS